MKTDERPQKGARKLVIEDETWWYYIAGGAYHIPIWLPNGEKTVHLTNDIQTKHAITPFDLRVYIDRNIRSVSEKKVQAFIDAHDARIEREKQEQLEELHKRVLNRALVIVGHSNDRMQEYHCGDEVATSNWQQNDTFMKELRTLIDHGRKKETE